DAEDFRLGHNPKFPIDKGRQMKHRNYPQLVAVVLLFIAPACLAQTQFPDTPAGNLTKGWLDVFNAGDIEKYREFYRKNFPARVERAARAMELRQENGGFELRKIEESTPTKIVALLQERLSDRFVRVSVEVEAGEPHQMTRLDLQGIPRPAEFAIPHLSESELISAARKKLDEETAADRFSGAALIAKNGKTVFAQAYGLADRDKKTPNTLKTRFRLGSMNKMFTAVATLQLVQNGKLDLKASFGNSLTDYPNKDVASKVTIDQLL